MSGLSRHAYLLPVVSGNSLHLSHFKCNVGCGYVIYISPVLWKIFSFISNFFRAFNMKDAVFCQKAFSAFVEMTLWFLSSSPFV